MNRILGTRRTPRPAIVAAMLSILLSAPSGARVTDLERELDRSGSPYGSWHQAPTERPFAQIGLGHDLARRFEEAFEDLEFRAGQLELRLANAGPMRARVETDLSELVNLVASSGRMRPAHNRLDACNELPWIEWLRQVVVGAEFQAYDAIDVFAARREHDDRHIAGLSNAFEHV